MKKIISFLVRYVPRPYLQRIAGVGKLVLGIMYRGDAVRCPVCDKSFKKFLPYGRINPRPNALCPNCLSLERHRLIWLNLQHTSDFFKRKLDVLHVAPEACFIPKFEKLHGDKYITADIESPLAKVKMDIHNIPFEANTFDVVLCNHVLEHVDDDIRAMQEIHRVLRPNGFAILQVPFFNPIPDFTYEDKSITTPREREKAFGQDDHVRKFGRDYPRRIEKAGMVAFEDDFAERLSADEIFRFGLAKGEILYKGIKK